VQQKPDGNHTKAVHDPNKPDKSTVFSGISHETRDDNLRRAGEAQNTNFAKRMWWAAVDKEKIEHLVTDVRSLIRELWNLIKPLQYDSMASVMETILANTIKSNTEFDQLVAIKDSISAIQGRLEANNKQILKGLATTAEMKAAQVALAYTDSSSHVPSLPTLPKRHEVLKKLDHLSPRKLSAFSPVRKDSTRGLAVYDGDKVFIEWKSTTPAMRSKLLPRAENLAALLNILKAETFQSLTCRELLGDDQKLGFVYHNPLASQSLEEPKSLLDLFSADDGIEPPSFSDRIRLALRVVQVVRNFHHTGWLHKGLQSDNILFFFHVSDVGAAVHDTDFVLAGFNFARLGPPTKISERPSANLNYDIYRHPEAPGETSMSFGELLDVYSLGTILLKIAEWKPLRYLVKSIVDRRAKEVPLNDFTRIRGFLISREGNSDTSNLRGKMGDIYASTCKMCLDGTRSRQGFGCRQEREGVGCCY
jgi:hypothetical protein